MLPRKKRVQQFFAQLRQALQPKHSQKKLGAVLRSTIFNSYSHLCFVQNWLRLMFYFGFLLSVFGQFQELSTLNLQRLYNYNLYLGYLYSLLQVYLLIYSSSQHNRKVYQQALLKKSRKRAGRISASLFLLRLTSLRILELLLSIIFLAGLLLMSSLSQQGVSAV